jgi:hypothetical protein
LPTSSGYIGIDEGNMGSGNIAKRVAATATVGGVASKLGGGKFKNGATTVAFLQLFSDSASYYEDAVGRKANPRPGDNPEGGSFYRPNRETSRQPPESVPNNIIGFNNDLTGDFIKDFLTQGGPISRTLNVIPTMNATAALHDFWLNRLERLGQVTPFSNVGTMLPAAVIGVSASVGNLVPQDWQSSPMVWYSATHEYRRQ